MQPDDRSTHAVVSAIPADAAWASLQWQQPLDLSSNVSIKRIDVLNGHRGEVTQLLSMCMRARREGVLPCHQPVKPCAGAAETDQHWGQSRLIYNSVD